jgi:hypothetical protein
MLTAAMLNTLAESFEDACCEAAAQPLHHGNELLS